MDSSIKFAYSRETLNYLLSKSSDFQSNRIPDYLTTTQKGKITQSHREQLIHWVSDTCSSHRASRKSEQLAISYIDLFLSNKVISQVAILELVGYICIALALKYEEGREITPKTIHLYCDQKFSIEAIMTTELFLLSILNWQLEIPTPSEILTYLFACTCEDFDFINICKCADGFTAVALMDYDISRNSSLMIAIASGLCVLQKVKYFKFVEEWVGLLEKELKIDIKACIDLSEKIFGKVTKLSVN